MDQGCFTRKKLKLKRETHNCCVPQCSEVKNPSNHMHLVPKDTVRRKKWALAIRTGKDLSEYMRVCSKHFCKEDYLPTGAKRVFLKKTAVPSQNIPVRSHEKVTTSPMTRKKTVRADRAKKRAVCTCEDHQEEPGSAIREDRKSHHTTSSTVSAFACNTSSTETTMKRPQVTDIQSSTPLGTMEEYEEHQLMDECDPKPKKRRKTSSTETPSCSPDQFLSKALAVLEEIRDKNQNNKHSTFAMLLGKMVEQRLQTYPSHIQTECGMEIMKIINYYDKKLLASSTVNLPSTSTGTLPLPSTVDAIDEEESDFDGDFGAILPD